MDKSNGIKCEKNTQRKRKHSGLNDLQDLKQSFQCHNSFEKLEESLHTCFDVILSIESIDKNATVVLLMELTKLWKNIDTIKKISDSQGILE